MIRHDTHHDKHHDKLNKSRISTEDRLWIVSGVIVSLALLAILYFGLTFFPAF